MLDNEEEEKKEPDNIPNELWKILSDKDIV